MTSGRDRLSGSILPASLLAALRAPVGHGPGYAAWVLSLRQALQAGLGAEFALDEDMNYNAAQSLACTLRGADRERRAWTFEVRWYVSSKGPLFAVYCFDAKWRLSGPGGTNHPIDPRRLPAPAQDFIAGARAVLAQRGLEEVGFEYFQQPAPGCLTQLDDLPATVFQSLFAELV